MIPRLPRLALVATLFAGVLTGGIGNASNGPPPLRVGSELEFPPYAFVDERGRPAGFSVELIKAVADTMGLSVSISTGTWDNVWEGLATGQLDVLPIVAKLPGREHLVDFSLPHTETFDAFFVRRGTSPIPDIAAARGKRIVVMRSDAAHHALLERGFPGDLVLVDTIPEGLSLIARGDYDAFLCSKVIGTLAVKSRGLDGLTAGPPIPDYERVFSFAVRKGNAELLEKLNQGLLIVKTNGEYDRIYERWLAAEDPWRKMGKYLLPGAGIATAAILIAGIWLVTLRRLVKKRTAELAERNELLRLAREGLEARVSQRTAELADANAALQAEMEVRSRGEATIRYRNVVLDGIGRIFRSALTSGTEEELGRAFLAVAGDVTQSRFGFVGEVGMDGRLHALASSGPGRESCTMDGTPGHGETPGNPDFHGLCGRVILEGKGFFTNDPASHPDGIATPGGEPRLSAFLGAPLIRDGRTIGMVGMANRESGYRAEDLDALTSLADAMVQSLMRKRAEEALQSSVAEKEILLKELAHRTKNNMQVVGSLLSLQAAGSADKELLEALADTQDRISAMALVHENLYRSGNFASLNMRTYLADLMASLVRTHQGKGGPVRTELDLEDVFASIDTALPCGLIVNELVSNSLKHAFRDRQGGRIYLSLRRTGQGLELRYRDDGPGLPRDLDLSRIESLGLKLVYNLAVRQLRGTMKLRRDPVSEFVITFDALDCAKKA